MRKELFISLRYLAAKRKEKFISIISLISILGVAVGVMALIIVLAVMSGFDNDLRDKIVQTNSHILIQKEGGLPAAYAVMEKIKDTEHVVSSAPFLNGQGFLKYRDKVYVVSLRGIVPDKEIHVTKLASYIKEGTYQIEKGGIVLGRELAFKINAQLGTGIPLISPFDGKTRTFKVAGIFNSGMYEYDAGLVFITLEDAQEFLGVGELVSGVGVKIDDLYKAEVIKESLQKLLGYEYWVLTWMDVNKNLFSALKLEKTVMFIILTLIVIVACFNIISTLIMVVMEKTRDIGILKAIGLTNGSIMKIFSLQGLIIGLIGTALGACGGFFLSYLLKTYQFIKLPPDIYYIDKLPVNVEIRDSVLIIVASILISFFSTLYPAYQASRLNPVEALRYE
ncbi:MAG: lipoprotein-releasing ABC transporter permease subunit [Candidatus Omnitrophota bacterium]